MQSSYPNIMPSAPAIDPLQQYSANPQPPSYTQYNQYNQAPMTNPPYQPTREQKYNEILSRYEISQYFASKLQQLTSFKIVFVFDDSGSMNTALEDSPLSKGVLKATRWEELQYFSRISIDIANIFNQNGTDVYFLNRPMFRGVMHPDQLAQCFREPPKGYTPLARILRTVLANNNAQELNERKLLVIIVTDGEPTDDNGRVNINEFKEALKSRNQSIFSTIVCCTDEEGTMDYLNNWDRNIPRLDVVDDYKSEKTEVIKAQGRGFSFSFGDYVVKSLIGSIDSSLDKLDERPTKNKSSCHIL